MAAPLTACQEAASLDGPNITLITNLEHKLVCARVCVHVRACLCVGVWVGVGVGGWVGGWLWVGGCGWVGWDDDSLDGSWLRKHALPRTSATDAHARHRAWKC
jgi:hypothetical protein